MQRAPILLFKGGRDTLLYRKYIPQTRPTQINAVPFVTADQHLLINLNLTHCNHIPKRISSSITDVPYSGGGKLTRLMTRDKAPDFRYDTPWDKGLGFYESAGKKSSVLVFLRYLGCPICQTDIANFKHEINLIEQKGANLFVILQSSDETVAGLTQKQDWPFILICDPKGTIFQQYRVEPGGILKYLHPAGLIAAIKSMLMGYRHGKFDGKETQLPAVFIVSPDKTIKFARYGKYISDIQSPTIIASHI
jgi:peroxiredoxin Q/BCP